LTQPAVCLLPPPPPLLPHLFVIFAFVYAGGLVLYMLLVWELCR
jgi:hypothetical protein